MAEVILEGWYCIESNYPCLKRLLLDQDKFKQSARKFDLKNLYITDLERTFGSFLNPTEVVGVIDLSGSLIPFFIKKQRIENLKRLIKSHNKSLIV